METPLISIITISYNAADTIRPTLQSVAQQSFKDFEHILIDGLSTDDTITIARQHGIPDLRIISEKDKGIYDAMNKGLDIATGQYVIFLNAGDAFASSDTLATYADAIDRYDPDIIYADTVIVSPQRHILRPRHLNAPKTLTVQSFAQGMLICHQAFMVRRKVAPAYDLQYRLSADYDWTIRCIKATTPEKCYNLDTVAIHYLDDGATEHNKLTSLRERFDIMKHHYGLTTAVARHISFIPRAIARRFRK